MADMSKHTPQSLSNSAVIFSLLLGGVVVSLSNSALNPAIPLFMQVFGVPLVSASWVLNAYVIAMAIGLIMVSYLATIFVRKTLYLTALAVFGLGSMMGYFSPSIDWVIGARFLQGLAGGILIPLSVGILYQIVPHQRQGQTMGLWGMVVMLGLAVGPLVGAYLVKWYGWDALFIINLPLMGLAWALVWHYLPHQQAKIQQRNLDKKGLLGLCLLLLGGFVWERVAHQYTAQFSEWMMVAMIGLGGILSYGSYRWWLYEYHHATPLLQVNIFDNRIYRYCTIISVTQTIGLMLYLILLPMLIQQVMHHPATWTGWVLMASTLIASVTTQLVGKIVDKQGARLLGCWGVILTASASFGLAWQLVDISIIAVVIWVCVHGLGVGLAYIPTTTVGFSQLPADKVTEGASLNNISRRICSGLVIWLAMAYVNYRQTQAVNEVGILQELLLLIGGMLLLSLPFAFALPRTSSSCINQQQS